MLYCLGLLVIACTVIFIVDGKNSTPETPNDNPVTQVVAKNDPTPTPDLPATSAPSVPTPTPLVLAGATECWNQFADEIDFDWSLVSDKSSVLFKKPQSSGEKVTGTITGSNANEVIIKLENCQYTEFYVSNLERRSSDRYYNDAPPTGTTVGEGDDGELVRPLDPKDISSDIYGDPLRKLSSMTLKEADGSYSVTLDLKFDKEYKYVLYETESFFLIVLERVTSEASNNE